MLLFFSAVVSVSFGATIPISIYSPDFSSTYIGNWSLNGNSTVVSNSLRLTEDVTYQKATAFWTSKICNADGLKFSAFFSFQIIKTSSQADGITFIIQQYSNTFGTAGEGIGYQSLPGRSIAIEYDTYQNGSQNDPDNGHIAVDIEGSVNHNTNATYMGIPSSSLLVNKATLSGIGINLADNNVKYTWIDYDGTNLQVRISTSTTRPASPIINIAYNLASYFNGASTFYGFGSATGAAREEHYIKSVLINNRYTPIDIVNNSYEQGNFSTSSITRATICQGESYLFNGVAYTADGTYTVNLINAANCDSTATLILDVRPLLTRWTGAVSTEWFNDANWNPKYPTACTDVIIPEIGNGVRYPILTTPGACKSITFEPGGAVLGLQHLTYTKAYVQIKLQRNKWYTLTTPLKSMFSGDYYFQGMPRTQMKLFDEVNPDKPEAGKFVGTWTNSFATLIEPLTPGKGFAFWVDTISYNYPNGIFAEHTDYFNSFPRRNADGSLIRTVVPYSGITGKPYPEMAQTMPKDSSVAYRFAMENASNALEDVRVPIKKGLNLVGNPLMTHLDFDLLYASNQDKISNALKFWNGTSFISYLSGDQIASTLDRSFVKIPPMQAFFVNGLEDADTQLDINLNEHFVADETTKLRSSSDKSSAKVLYLKSSLGNYDSYAAIGYNKKASNGKGSEDAVKLFSQYTELPEVYTVADNYALDINQFNHYPYMAPLNIKTSSRGNIKLSFTGAASFEDVEVVLYNTLTGEKQDLKENSVYNFNYSGAIADSSLYIEFRSANTSSDIKEKKYCPTSKCIQIYAKTSKIVNVLSYDDEIINRVTIYELNGKQIFNKLDINSSVFEAQLIDKPEVILVQVETNYTSYLVKLFLK